jgi:uncharacterized protein YndB with AHSA1/START domain
MDTHPLVLERTFDAPAEKVWQALSDEKKMKQWYFDIDTFKPEVGFEFSFSAGSAGKKYVHLCKVTEVVAQQKLAYTWAYEGYAGSSEVSFELFPDGGKTRLVLTHTGLHSFPDLPDFAKSSFLQGWTAIIGTNLKKYVEQA